MATLHPEWSGAVPTPGQAPAAGGPLMTLAELAAVAAAPKRPYGTEVSVRAKPIPELGGLYDHMFVEYDDGRHPLIARGGPSMSGLVPFLAGKFAGANHVMAGVYPAEQSGDYGQERRVLAQRFMPGVTPEQAAAPARLHAEGVNRGANAYGLGRNSNSFAADAAEPILGQRIGDRWTPGFEHRLYDSPPPTIPGSVFTGPLDPDDLTPIVRTPPY